MNLYSSYCDDFYVNMNLSTEMELPQNREAILHFFERLQKSYPTMRNFYSRDKGDFILEEDKDGGQYRWSTIEKRRICSGLVNPGSVDDALEQHKLILELAPCLLSVSPLDCEALDLLFAFAVGFPASVCFARRALRENIQVMRQDFDTYRKQINVPKQLALKHCSQKFNPFWLLQHICFSFSFGRSAWPNQAGFLAR